MMINKRFGKWTIISEVRLSNKKIKVCDCRCDCGNIKTIILATLLTGRSTQCSECRKKTYDMRSLLPEYKIWGGLFTRCYNSHHKTYKSYGAKGIRVSDDWHDFMNFYKDMGSRPKNYQIDRIDPDGDYCKENCRWISKAENRARQRNRGEDLTGKRFYKWLVLMRDWNKPTDHSYYICQCECGHITTVSGSLLKQGKSKQCLNCKHRAHKGWGVRYKEKLSNTLKNMALNE